jgi:hypothetical protein
MKALLCLLFSISLCHAQDWPRWRGPAADGRWNPPGLPTDVVSKEPQRLWKAEIGAGFGGVTVSDGRVYVMDRQKSPTEVERVLCFDGASGKLLWQHEWEVSYGGMDYGTGPRASVNVSEGGAAVLGVGVTSGERSYAWFKTGADGKSVLVGTGGSGLLYLNPVQASDAGAYFVVVTDALGSSVTSQPATVTVLPAND